MKRTKKLILATMILAGMTVTSIAQAKQIYNKINFVSSVSTSVQQDMMSATLFYQEKGADLKLVNQRVANALNNAIAKAKVFKDIQISDTSRSTYISNTDKKDGVTEWVDRVSFDIKSSNFTDMAALISQLNGQMAVQNMHFGVSPEVKEKVEHILTKELLAKVKEKADLIEQSLSAKSYKIIDIHLGTVGDARPHPVYMLRSADVGQSDGEMSVVSGERNLKMQANVSIKLEYD